MKKLAWLLLCFNAPVAFAHLPFTGFYLSGEVGLTNARVGVDPFVDMQTFDLVLPSDYDISATSAAGLLGLGYLYQFNERFVVGLEATAGYTHAKTKYHPLFTEIIPPAVNVNIQTDLTSTLTNDFALLFKPGVLAGENTLFYVSIGPRWGNFETTNETSMVLVAGPVATAQGSETLSGYQLGITAGVGIQQILTDNLHLIFEYLYTDYGNIDAPNATGPILVDGVPNGDLFVNTPEITAITHNVMLGLSYQW